jgi:threonine dehydratase
MQFSEFSWTPTPLFELESDAHCRVLVKDESKCPTHTFKDRLGWELGRRLLVSGAGSETVVASITLGNTAISLAAGLDAYFKQAARPTVFGVFPSRFEFSDIGPDSSGRSTTGRAVLARLRSRNVICVEADTQERRLEAADVAELARNAGLDFSRFIDVSTGIDEPCYSPLIAEAMYQTSTLGYHPEAVLVPVGAGVLFDAAVQDVVRNFPSCRVFGATVLDPHSIADKIDAFYSPYYESLVERGVAESPLDPRSQVVIVDEAEIRAALRDLRDAVDCEPSAAAAFALLRRQEIEALETVLVINTGNGIPAL